MTNIMQSEIFFFISSIGFVILGILSVVVLVQVLNALSSFSRILRTVESDIDSVGDTTKEMLRDMRNNGVFKLLFKPKKKHKKQGSY